MNTAEQNYKKNAWTYSLNDLLMLMICFFVMIFAATNEDVKIKEVFLNKNYDIYGQKAVIKEKISAALLKENMDKYISFSEEDNFIELLIKHSVLFRDNIFTEEANNIAHFLSNLLYQIPAKKIFVKNYFVNNPSSLTKETLEKTIRFHNLMKRNGALLDSEIVNNLDYDKANIVRIVISF